MERMLVAMTNNPLATAAGLFAMVCLAGWPLFRARSAMLGTYTGNNLGFVVHYALLQHWTAASMNGLMCIQTLVAMGLVRWPRLRLAYYVLMLVLVITTLATWRGIPSLLAAAATTLSTLGRMQCNETVLRILLLASTPFWAAHDLFVGSMPGLIADVMSMATGTVMLARCCRPVLART